MKKKILIIAIFCLAAMTWAGKEITVINTSGKINLRQFNLKCNVFPNEDIYKLDKKLTLRICESIDNSNLIIMGPQTPSDVLKKLFDTAAINNSVRELLNRGGIIFWGPTSWKYLCHLPKSLIKLYDDYNIPSIDASKYSALKTKAGKETYMTCSPNKECSSQLLREPNNFISNATSPKYRLMAIRYFSNLPKDKFDILFYYRNLSIPTFISTKKIPGNGAMIFTYCYNLFQQTNHPLVENIVHKAYGPLKKIFTKEQIRQKFKKGQKKSQKIIDKPIIVINKNAKSTSPNTKTTTIELYNWLKNSKPTKNTEVKVASDNEMLYVSFLCREPNIDKMVTQRTVRDSDIWNDDCVELFIAPMYKQGEMYHYIVNSKGIVYDSKNKNTRWNSNIKVTTALFADSWQADLAIPLSDLGLKNENHFKINFCREEKQLGELTSWSKAFNFNNPLTLGYLTMMNKESLLKEVAEKSGANLGGCITIRPAPLWQRCYTDSFPDNLSSVLETNVLVARNEKESISFWISNSYDANYYFRLEPEITVSGSEVPYQDVFTLKSAIPWQATTGEVYAEPLVKLDEGNILVLPGMETRIIWIDVKTSLPAGKYKWHFSLVPVNSDMATKKISVNLEVLPLTFPQKLPVDIFTFGPYGFSWAQGDKLRKKYWQTCADYHIDWVQGSDGPAGAISLDSNGKLIVSSDPEKYAGNEFDIQAMNLKCVFGYGVYARFLKRLKELGIKKSIKSPEIQTTFKQWFANWISYLKDNKFNFSKAMFPLWDEPQKAIIDELIIAGNIMHKVNPDITIPSTIATWSTMDDITKLNNVIDVWIPWEPRIMSRQNSDKELAFYHQTQKKIFPYLCSTSGNTAPYLDYFRYRGIRSYIMKCDGFCLWAFNSWRDNDWNSSSAKKKNGAWLFQHGDSGPITTIRAEAFREGIEDFYLLQIADNLLKKSDDKKLKQLLSIDVLNSLLDNSDPIATQKWRNELITTIAKNNKRQN